MARDRKVYSVLSAAPARAIDSSTNATPIAITDVAHGLVTGDRVTVIGHATNTNANGTWTITRTGANTFTLDGSVGNGVGGATGTWAIAGRVIDVADFSSVVLAFDTDNGGTAAFTAKIVGSIAEVAPDFARAQAAANQFDFVDVIDLQSGVEIPGDTGFVVATADDHRMFEVNTNGLKWVTVLFTAGTAGFLTVKANLYANI